MRTILFLILVIFSTRPAAAQAEFDLNQMPLDWVGQIDTDKGITFMRFEGSENRLFRFTYRVSTGTSEEQIEIWANANSQTVFARSGDVSISFTPHDCWPSLGSCRYTKAYSNGSTEQYFTETAMIGEIRHMQTFLSTASGPVLRTEECLLLDEFGFTKLSYRINHSTGEAGWGIARAGSGPQSQITVDQLAQTCSAPDRMS